MALALRSNLLVDALDAGALEGAARGLADAVTIDLGSPAAYGQRADARRAGNHALEALVAAGRQVLARVSDQRSGETEGDIMSIVRPGIAGIVLASQEVPQDAREIDVSIRKQEMRRGIEPGSVRLVAEIDSAAGLRGVPDALAAIDRHSAVALDVVAFARDLLLPGPPSAHMPVLEYAMAELAVTCTAAEIVWVLFAPGVDSGTRSALATRAHALGAAGVFVASDAEAQGYNSLFTPAEDEVQAARLIAAEWTAMRKRDEHATAIAGRIVDRRTVRHARTLIARADAIAARGKVKA